MSQTKFLIIDGNSIGFRAITARNTNEEELKNSNGQLTGGIQRFIYMFNGILHRIKPTHIIVGYDTSDITFRHNIDPEYKLNRRTDDPEKKKEKELIYQQLNEIKRVLDAINVKHDNVYLYEGDDIVGTYSNISNADENYILSGDKDVFQLINSNTSVIYPIKGTSEVLIYNEELFRDKFGINVNQFIDYKSLLGDKGDNVKGIDRCGTKTSSNLLNKFGNIETIIQNLDNEYKDIRGWKKLSENMKNWDYNKTRKLVTIEKNCTVNYNFNDCKLNINWDNAISLFEEYEFKYIIRDIKEGKFYK